MGYAVSVIFMTVIFIYLGSAYIVNIPSSEAVVFPTYKETYLMLASFGLANLCFSIVRVYCGVNYHNESLKASIFHTLPYLPILIFLSLIFGFMYSVI
jgi:hypothetical protein